MGGTIDVDSKRGYGSTITVNFVFEKATEADARKQSEKLSSGVEIPSDVHVLLAEDNEINAAIALRVFGDIGVTVDHAENGQVAYDMFCGNKPGTYKAVFMDIQMPVMNGYEAARAIRSLTDVSQEKQEEAKKIPIIAMTANAFSDDIQNALAAGMDAHVAKPLDLSVLQNTVYEVLKKKREGTS